MNHESRMALIKEASSFGISSRLLGLSGYSGEKVIGFLQRIAKEMDVDNECYLEVGVFQGMSLISVAGVRSDLLCVGVDNFSQFDPDGKNKELVLERMALNNIENIRLVEKDFEDALQGLDEHISGKMIGLFFVDGPHDYRSQLMCLEMVKPYLSANALIVVDDSNYSHVRQANADFLRINPEFKLVFQAYTFGHPMNHGNVMDEFRMGWWNGINVIVKDQENKLEVMYPFTEADKTLFYNDHIVHSEKYSYLAPEAVNLIGRLLDYKFISAFAVIMRAYKKMRRAKIKIQGYKKTYRHMNVNTDDIYGEYFNPGEKNR